MCEKLERFLLGLLKVILGDLYSRYVAKVDFKCYVCMQACYLFIPESVHHKGLISKEIISLVFSSLLLKHAEWVYQAFFFFMTKAF